MRNEVCITLDMDWAPDFVINHVAEILIRKKIKATWFATHMSKAVLELVKNPLFEVGLHPNFLPNSTQGTNPEEILRNLKSAFPTAKSIRTHSLLQSSPLLMLFHKFGIENDVSLLLERTKDITPHYSPYFHLYRFPFFWEDDLAMSYNNWEVSPLINIPGMKIFNFHPIHIYLNSKNMENYNKLKTQFGNDSNYQKFEKFINNESDGVGMFFASLTDYLVNKKSATIIDLQQEFIELNGGH